MSSDSEAIQALFDEFASAANACSVDRLMAIFTEDMIFLPPNEPLKQGAAVLEYVKSMCEGYSPTMCAQSPAISNSE